MSRGTDISQFKRVYRQRNVGEFPDELSITLRKESDLKYGENPNQQAALYTVDTIAGQQASRIAELTEIRSVRSDGRGKGGLSLTNLMDVARGMDTLKYFDVPACAIMKHNVISGFARQNVPEQSLAEVYRLARDSDRRSNFGGTVLFNRPLDLETVDALLELYPRHIIDVVAVPEYEEGALQKLEQGSKNIRLSVFSNLDTLPKFKGDDPQGLFSIKEMPSGRIALQDLYLTSIRSSEDLILDPMKVDKHGRPHTIERDPTEQELQDLLTAWYINIAGARSNGVVLVRNGVLVANGSGQVERVGAIEQAIVKAVHKAFDREGLEFDALMGMSGVERLKDNPLLGAACASDAFFPFPDSVERLGRVGVKAILQPYGSVRDGLVIDEANRFGIAMPATLERCFGHF
jgi:phosphoribosylaminoimidazolecarboxamide formyltransferase/IMP cyclohydrolase